MAGICHIIPYLELAKLIAQKGHHVSFLSTPKNIHRLPKLPSHLTSLIHFINFPLPKVDNLPDDAEATSDVPNDVVPFLKKAYDLLQQPVTQFLESSNLDWILYDFAPYWVGPIASKLGIKSAFFSIFSTACLGFIGPPSVLMGYDNARTKPKDYMVLPSWVPFSTIVVCRYYEGSRVFNSLESEDSGVTDRYRLGASIQNCDIVVTRSCSELEPEWIQVLENIYQKPILPVGQLPNTTNDNNEDKTGTWQWIKDWLDKQPKGKVVYVAFGSETKPNQQQVIEIALGLMKSQLPFFWVLKTQCGPSDHEVLKLPDGFEDRVKGRGVVYTSWAPQLKILGHGSVGGFLTHGGGTSMVEAAQNEIPIVLLPFLVNQGLSARFLEEKNIGYAVPRDEQDGSFTSDSLAKSLKLVVIEEEGRIYREKIKEVKDLFVSSDKKQRYVDSFLTYLKAHKNPKNN